DYAANLDHNLWDLHARLRSGRYQAPVIRRVYIPKANSKVRPLGITQDDRGSSGAEGRGMGAQRSLRAGFSEPFSRLPPEPQPGHGAAPTPGGDAALGEVRRGS